MLREEGIMLQDINAGQHPQEWWTECCVFTNFPSVSSPSWNVCIMSAMSVRMCLVGWLSLKWLWVVIFYVASTCLVSGVGWLRVAKFFSKAGWGQPPKKWWLRPTTRGQSTGVTRETFSPRSHPLLYHEVLCGGNPIELNLIVRDEFWELLHPVKTWPR